MGSFHFDSKYDNVMQSVCAVKFGNRAWRASNRWFSRQPPPGLWDLVSPPVDLGEGSHWLPLRIDAS